MKRKGATFTGRNCILRRLPKAEWKRLQPNLELITMARRTSLYEPNRPFDYVYFPETGVASIVTVLNDGTETEVATVGYEGIIGLPVFFGAATVPGRAFWQIPGDAFRLRADLFRRESKNNGPLREALHRYAQGYFNQLAYTVSCNRSHSIQQRASRWLLMSTDRVGRNRFELTHEFLSHMLGVRRSGVTEVMGALQRARILRYSRGVITILNRHRLEAAACECYAVVRDEFCRLLE
jgi:CRP-like cAMP-binding protein